MPVSILEEVSFWYSFQETVLGAMAPCLTQGGAFIDGRGRTLGVAGISVPALGSESANLSA